MDRFMRLKATIILVCSGLAFSAFAQTNGYTSTTSTQSTATVPADQAPADTTQLPANQSATQPGSTDEMNTTTGQTTQSSDATLLSAVQSALGSYADKINVTVNNGVVYLSGQLDSDTDYEKVVTLAQSIQGVGDINVDKLTVKDSQSPLNDTFLTAKIKGALIQADLMGKDLPSWSLGVETKDGQVYLSGQVASAEEKQAILNVVKSVKGIGKINDKMEVAGANAATAGDSSTIAD
ncbi:osmotically inducible protein Y [Legionella lansingensis]|uniref:Osmotically inducible protein Y n=1 Tax=Legionella lansingensis TaxID=45067 RepID=A0A0W0V792_9GAMM|nr:BON domain-containing protein [Legionella lansingensis]KTD15979.1 osmotically inducible protein Y [Legionella lansingensis]SNV56530.1 osmotically inducible protein Y [Legionella lansingensis]